MKKVNSTQPQKRSQSQNRNLILNLGHQIQSNLKHKILVKVFKAPLQSQIRKIRVLVKFKRDFKTKLNLKLLVIRIKKTFTSNNNRFLYKMLRSLMELS